MMLRLLAAAFGDGWAFVRKGDRVLLVRPPYREETLRAVSERTVEKAVAAYGFTAAEEEFEDWRSLVEHLKKRIVEARKASGLGEPDFESVRQLIRSAPLDILQSYLERVQSELVPGEEWDAALDLLTTLLSSETVKSNPTLLDRAVELLKRCREGQAGKQDRMDSLADEAELSECFPSVVRLYGASEVAEYTRRRSQPGMLMPICAST